VGKRSGTGGKVRLGAGKLTARRACGIECFVHDPPDGTGAPAALGAAPEATIDVAGRPWRSLSARQGAAHVVVGEYVAGTDDHTRRARRRDWYHL